ncbi:MAG: Gfo/Idh/MocA family oxidoreductase, partial [Deltaproteobacteria bacterium]|nr:Gfo/Idh/MocA family oxidoreductase [Deltaproteobacteria bacterium]
PQITQITQKGKKDKDKLAADERRLTQISENTIRVHQRVSAAESKVTIGLIGAGNFTGAVLLPALKKTGVRFQAIASSGGVTGTHLGKKFGFEFSTTDTETIFNDSNINTVFVTTRHNSHARFVMEALTTGKNVFVEKPLCMNRDELSKIETLYNSKFKIQNSKLPLLMVGYNRRFSPHTIKIKELLAGRAEPLCMNMTVNAGIIPQDHWIHDPEVGGGRIVGEGCHFIDLMVSLTGSMVQSVSACMAGEGFAVRTDKMSIVLGFADGSVGTVNYFANGSKSYPKEMLEVFSEGRVLRMENFRITLGYGFKGFKRFRTLRQDKGHNAEVAAFVERIAGGGEALIPFEQLANTTAASFAAVRSAREGRTIIL